MNLTATWNAEFIDSMYKQWKTDPEKLSRDWRYFFEGFELAISDKKWANDESCVGILTNSAT